ncbi:MAG: cation acetate symporter [Burkholderiales bacterium]|nr:cation acetate symporter [Phycisphaerae bacterium]
MTIAIFLFFVFFTLGLSWWLGKRAKTASGYFAAHGQVGWFVNGIAFAGDYLSAASFLGICGLIAFYGYDGFLYSIGFLAGWVVALFVIAEPIKKLGKFTFADALSAKFGNSRGITLAAAISTLVISIFYLIPQMVGAGSLIKPLLGLPEVLLGPYDVAGMKLSLTGHALGVIGVGGIVILIVVTAGMVSTTWVQFIKGSMLVVFCAVLVVAILARGVPTVAGPQEATLKQLTGRTDQQSDEKMVVSDVKLNRLLYGDTPADKPSAALGPAEFIKKLGDTTIVRSLPATQPNGPSIVLRDGATVGMMATPGDELLLPGGYFKGIRSEKLVDRLDFVSLMLALFCGTAALPHILIRYYTVKDSASARKSTVVGIIAIGFFYVLTLYIGLGAMVSGNIDPKDSNMSAPLLAQTFGQLPFAIISAIAFTTVLGTVSGLILAASGAIAHDLIETVFGHQASDHAKVNSAKWAAAGVGVIAVVLGILFKSFNASFLVGWAFNIAASANLPAIVMLLFWGGTTRQGIVASILVGLISSLTWLLLTKEAFVNIYGYTGHLGIAPFSQPGLVTIPLAFITLVVVSLMTRPRWVLRGLTG